jgi:hypothetical protein
MALEEKTWTTRDELLYLKNIGKTLDLDRLKVTQKEMLQGYIKGMMKRNRFMNDNNRLDFNVCLGQAYIMLYSMK